MNNPHTELIDPMTPCEPRQFIPIDSWEPSGPEDEIFRTTRGLVMLNVSGFFKMEPNPQLDAFVMSTKRSYNNPEMREHIVKYLNYFEKYYDTDLELAMVYCRLKYLIHYEPKYTKDAFIYDLHRYIMTGPVSIKLGYLNRDNYQLNLTYKNVKNPNLQYSDC